MLIPSIARLLLSVVPCDVPGLGLGHWSPAQLQYSPEQQPSESKSHHAPVGGHLGESSFEVSQS